MKAELHVVILVKVADHVFNVFRLQFPVAIFSQVPTYALAANCPCAETIDSLECGIGLELGDRCEYLPQPLNLDFILGQADKEVLKLEFCLITNGVHTHSVEITRINFNLYSE